ncbi:MAG TPA: alpha/beta fold hydrolase [Anaerolineales bacterium]|nr:alpha/beta fold hydrolase [Anaerolineales bacterium]
MAQQKGIAEGNTLWGNNRSGSSTKALQPGWGSLLKHSSQNLRLYDSHPHPVADYAEAVQRVESKIASEVDFYEGSHSFLLTHGHKTAKVILFVHGFPNSPAPFKELAAEFYSRGYNVLAMTMPFCGLADRMNTEQEKMRAEDFMHYGDKVVDIAQGLGDHITMAGISAGGLVTAWVAQQRRDVDLAVLISPGLGLRAIPRFLTPFMSWALRVLPNWYIWEDPVKKENAPRLYNYVRFPSKVVGQVLRLAQAVNALARQAAPAAGSIMVITNLNDPDIDAVAVDRVTQLWRLWRLEDVQSYQFPAELGLGHDIIDVTDPHMNVAAVYPKLLELIDR